MSSKITKVHPEVCEHYCTNVSHGNLITAALTKTDVPDEALIYYMLSVCEHFSTAKDSAGRSALHMAASCGKSRMVSWLVTYRNGKLEDKDRESGYTALHRSLFYGKINTAVALIKLGSNMRALDEENLSPLEHVMKDALECKCKRAWWASKHSKLATSDGWDGSGPQQCSAPSCHEDHLGELYCWGSNSNYTLLDMHGDRHAELSHFHKQYPEEHINTIHLEKYHCMVTCGSKVYAWGHGLGGRLGLNTDGTVLVPEVVKIDVKSNKYGDKYSTMMSPLDVARNHSIFLDVRSNVWTCGLNEHDVLGVSSDELSKALLPICVSSLKGKKIVSVACGKYHSVACSLDTLFTWGLNGGQLGHASECGQYISTPRKVTRLLDGENDRIIQVCCSDAATAILASNNVIYILHEFQRQRIALKSEAIFRQLHLFGGKLESRTKDPLPHTELHVAVVTATCNLLLWRESDPHLRRCVFSLGRPLRVSNAVLNARGCVFTTRDHEVFQGTFKRRKGGTTTAVKVDKVKDKERELRKSAFHMFLEKDECVMVKVDKVPRIHRACYVTSDPDGDNFIVLQNNRCKEFFYDIPSIIREDVEMKEYLRILYSGTCDENSLYDFRFIVGKRTFYCHKYIVAHASADLAKLIRDSSDNVYKVETVSVDIFEQMLQFIYTGSCNIADIESNNKTISVIDCNNKEQEEAILKDMSAFAEYTTSKNSNKVVTKSSETDKTMTQLKLLLLCAKKFCLHSLQKRVEHYFEHKRSRCHLCVGCFEKVEPLIQYQRKQFVDFSDVDVICKNGDKIRAHKCMLMRLEYFRNMFSARWNQDRKAIKIDYPPMHVQLLVDFVYTDRLDDVNDLENLLTLLVLSDEFLVEKLRALCEYSLCKHINIKTVVNLYQCSILYGAWILKKMCSQFIIAHLTELLEMRSLDCIDDIHLVDISNIYLKHKSGLFDKRLITPFSYIPDIEEPPSEFRLEMIESTKYQAIEAQKAARKRTRRHKNSVSVSEAVLDSNNSSSNMEVLESESNIKESSTNVRKPSSRILTINSATQKLNKSLETDGEFVNLSMTSSSLVSSSFDEADFPDLSSVNLSAYSKSPGKCIDWRGLPKFSQKARKRLQSENSCSTENAMQSSITNPWKVIEVEPNATTAFDVVQKNTSDIVKATRLQKERLHKMRNRLLSSSQIEDRAISSLEKFYNIDNIEDELIEVRRLESGNIALPTWVAKN